MISVIGASNVDIQGFASIGFRPGESLPGTISLAAGGVGRNIAENAARLGESVFFLTALGNDFFSAPVIGSFDGLPVDFSRSVRDKDIRTSLYLCVLDSNGMLAAAVNDMSAVDRITAGAVRASRDPLSGSGCVVVEANLSDEAIGAAIECAGETPVVADCVSGPKCARLKPYLHALAAIKPNVAEAELLTGVRVETEGDLVRAAAAFHEKGVGTVALSLGSRGLFLSDGFGFRGIASPADMKVKSVSGAGDAVTAVLALSAARGYGGEAVLRYAQAAASLACATEETVNREMDWTRVTACAETLDIRIL